MAYENNKSYREIPFYPGTRYGDFYTYMEPKDIRENCENRFDAILRCRTVGVLQSINGRFFLSDFDTCGVCSEPCVQVSVVYLKSPLQSTVMPYPVQVFGFLQWKNRPVIFAKMLQPMTVSTALRLKNALTGITSIHLANSHVEDEDQDPT